MENSKVIRDACWEIIEARGKATQGEWRADGCGDIYTLEPEAVRVLHLANQPYSDAPGVLGTSAYWSEGNPNSTFACLSANRAHLIAEACEKLAGAVERLSKGNRAPGVLEISRTALREAAEIIGGKK